MKSFEGNIFYIAIMQFTVYSYIKYVLVDYFQLELVIPTLYNLYIGSYYYLMG